MDLVINARFLTQRVTGVQRYAREVTPRVAAALGSDRVVGIAPRGAADAGALGYPVVTAGATSGHLWEQLELPRLRPDARALLWSPCNVGPLAVARQVLTLHDVFSVSRPQWVSRPFHLWYSALLPPLTRRVRRIITVSRWSRDQIMEYLDVPEEKLVVIPEGVDPRFSPPEPGAMERARRALDLPDEYVLVLGSLEPRKNLERVVIAWSRLPEESRPPLLIAGGSGLAKVFGDYDAARLVDREGVRLLGYVPDEHLPALYAGATLFVYASLEEGFGLPPLEALACGTDVVTSNTSAMAEHCAPYATLVDPTSVEDIGRGIASALSSRASPEERSRRAAAVRAAFDWDRTARETVRVIGEASSAG